MNKKRKNLNNSNTLLLFRSFNLLFYCYMGDIVIMLIICLLINLFMVFNTQSIVESISTMK